MSDKLYLTQPFMACLRLLEIEKLGQNVVHKNRHLDSSLEDNALQAGNLYIMSTVCTIRIKILDRLSLTNVVFGSTLIL